MVKLATPFLYRDASTIPSAFVSIEVMQLLYAVVMTVPAVVFVVVAMLPPPEQLVVVLG
jgi:hypothetical protein